MYNFVDDLQDCYRKLDVEKLDSNTARALAAVGCGDCTHEDRALLRKALADQGVDAIPSQPDYNQHNPFGRLITSELSESEFAELSRWCESGYIVESGDWSALGDRLRAILEDPALRESFESAALRFAREHLTWRTNARCYNELYTRVLSNSSARSGDDAVRAAMT